MKSNLKRKADAFAVGYFKIWKHLNEIPRDCIEGSPCGMNVTYPTILSRRNTTDFNEEVRSTQCSYVVLRTVHVKTRYLDCLVVKVCVMMRRGSYFSDRDRGG